MRFPKSSRKELMQPGFSLIEAMVAMSIMSLAGAALLLGIEASLRTTSNALDETMAAGLAEQLVDELLGHPYMSPGMTDPYQYPLSPNSYEAAGAGRERLNDTDDYNNYRAQPAEGLWGYEIGHGDGKGNLRHPNFRLRSGYFSRWKQEIDVFYVSESDPSQRLPGSQTSNLRAAEVRILHEDADGTYRTLANVRRVFAYVPPPP